MPLSIEQVGALHHARQILEDAGLLGSEGGTSDVENLASQLVPIFDAHLGSDSVHHPHILDSHYFPPPAAPFTAEQILSGANRLTRKSYVNAIVHHPVGAVIEYPQSGSRDDEAVAHVWSANPENPGNPRSNVQYSLGDSEGQHPDIVCHLLVDNETQAPVKCRQVKVKCESFYLKPAVILTVYPGRGIKRCSFGTVRGPGCAPSDFAAFPSDQSSNSHREVFFKTLGFFCALMEHGCLFSDDAPVEVNNEDPDIDDVIEGIDLEQYEILQDARSRIGNVSHCKGKLGIYRDNYLRPFIRCVVLPWHRIPILSRPMVSHSCEHYKKGHRAHLLIRSLDQFHIEYLQALLRNDALEIKIHEQEAALEGYGPLVPCTYFAAPSVQKMLCRESAALYVNI